MDLNSILIWIVAASCGLSLLQLFRFRRRSWGRIGMVAGILLLLGVLTLLVPDTAGYAGGAVWGLLLVLPGFGNAFVDLLVGWRKYRLAKALSRIVCWLHPFDECRTQPMLIEALQRMREGRVDEAQELLEQIRQSPSRSGRTVIVLQTRNRGNWQEFLDWLDSQPQREEWLEDPLVLDAYLQGLGETERLEELFAEFERLLIDRQPHLSRTMLNLIRMKAAAFGGEPELVEEIFEHALKSFGPETRAYWVATARQAAGESASAGETFTRLLRSRDGVIARAAQRRLRSDESRDSVKGTDLDRIRERVLSLVADVVRHEHRFSIMRPGSFRRTRGTWGVALVLLTVFLFELPGGSEDLDNLIDMGALVIPMSLLPGEWWRIVTAAFLHFGPLHLSLNMAGLLIFGRRLERAWGTLLTLLCYLVAAVLSIALTAWFSPEATAQSPAVLVGASGGVMGLIGALLGHAGVGLMRGRSALVSREFNLLFLVVLLQVVFDARHENVSSKCHLLGLAIGVLFGLAVNLVPTSRHSRGE
jgi:rhomboid protease GluP